MKAVRDREFAPFPPARVTALRFASVEVGLKLSIKFDLNDRDPLGECRLFAGESSRSGRLVPELAASDV